MPRLSELLDALPPALAPEGGAPAADPVVRGLAHDSRRVQPGDLFVALSGERADGHAYLREARSLGAVAFLVEHLPPDFAPDDAPVVRVPDTRRALAPVSVRFFGDPCRELALVGVTGTNGKTSTTALLRAMLEAAGRRAGVIGTLGVRYGDVDRSALNTTPESLELQRTLRDMCTAGVDTVAMEVSSHGLALGRVDGCRFRAAAFTNLSQDHLDFHPSMEAYREAKLRLFRELLTPGAPAVVVADDPASEAFGAAAREAGARCLRVSRRAEADAELRVEAVEVRATGTRLRLVHPEGRLELECPLVGDFNVENLAVAAGLALALGVPPEAVARGAAECPQVPGRTERVRGGGEDEPTVLVDYAHTPDAVEKLLRAVRPLARGRLIAVFGCGGDRDRSKRPLMAKAVADWSDRTVATSDNPRTESPAAILADVEGGLGALARVAPEELDGRAAAYAVVEDRRAAIELAVGIAGPEDTVVIAGKGHEDYQIVGHERFPFDDREEARRALRRRRA